MVCSDVTEAEHSTGRGGRCDSGGLPQNGTRKQRERRRAAGGH